MKTKHWLTILIILTTLILSACTIDINVVVNPDGSGSVGMTYKLTAEDLKSLEGMGMTKDTICTEMNQDNEDFTFTQETHGDEIWCVGSNPVANLAEMKDQMGGEGFEINTLELTTSQFTFDADANMSQQEGAEGFDLGMLNITYSMTAPGKVTNHNGDSITGNTVTWELPLGASKNLHLESKVGAGGGLELGGMGGDNTGWIIGGLLMCCCCLIVIVIIVVVVVVLMRRKRNSI